jgi:hypothetical protein
VKPNKRFEKPEAESKVGKHVRSLAEFAGVPKGTTGRVVRADRMGNVRTADGKIYEEYDAVIEWDLPGQQSTKPLQDWFPKDEYEQWIEEI